MMRRFFLWMSQRLDFMVFGSIIFRVDFTNVNLMLFLILILVGVFSAVGFGL